MVGVLGKLLRPQKKAMHRSTKALELESAKEILAEVFHVRPYVVEDMIQRRLEERCLAVEEGCSPRRGCGLPRSANVSSHGPELRGSGITKAMLSISKRCTKMPFKLMITQCNRSTICQTLEE